MFIEKEPSQEDDNLSIAYIQHPKFIIGHVEYMFGLLWIDGEEERNS